MRGLVIGLLLAAASARAEAKIVIMEAPVPHNCRSAPTWSQLEICLKKIDKITVLRDTADAKLVVVGDLGTYLYLKRPQAWQLGGSYEGGPVVLIDLHAVTINKHLGYRIDLGTQLVTEIAVDDNGGAEPATIRSVHTLFCSGDGYNCVDALTRCDAIVHGKSYFVFRGTLTVEDQNIVHVVGDRTRSGPTCTGQEKMYLGWAPQPR